MMLDDLGDGYKVQLIPSLGSGHVLALVKGNGILKTLRLYEPYPIMTRRANRLAWGELMKIEVCKNEPLL